MTTITQLPTPALLLDLDVLEANLRRMADHVGALGVALRPHVKTHKCVEVARLQRDGGARGITVSTLAEAQVFARHGFDDITWAMPVSLARLDEACELATQLRLRLVVDSREAIDALDRREHPFHVWLKVDSGYHRCGVDPHSAEAVELAHRLAHAQRLAFDGLLTHSGHAYQGRSRDEITAVAEEERRLMVELADRLRADGIPVEGVSVGSTPAMAVVERLDGVTEARPGNYAFYDYSQVVLGSCSLHDCALTVLASVISSQPGSNHAVVDAGALALSKDTGPADAPRPTMGEIFKDYTARTLRPDARVVTVTQEHGIVTAPLPVGTAVRILPNHSCLTAACFDEYHVVRGDEVVDRWHIWRAR
jgi:D-serine deaminase-like pyridoxal phosphate-dependent protein